MPRYRCILADPPWPFAALAPFESRRERPQSPPYPTMPLEAIERLQVDAIADSQSHLWLWTTNGFLHAAFHVMDAWGFKYHATIVWVKPSGIGAYFMHTTQYLLFGYRGKMALERRFLPTHFHAPALRHSRKPENSFDLIEAVSPAPRVELFARRRRFGWDAWGNEVASNLEATL